MKKKYVLTWLIALTTFVSAQTLSPVTIGKNNTSLPTSNDKHLSYGVNNVSATSASKSNKTAIAINNTGGSNSFLNVYPNPADKNLWVELQFMETGTADIFVFDNTGKKIENFNSKINVSGFVNKQLDISALPAGNYFLSIAFTGANSTTTQTLTKKFQVVH